MIRSASIRLAILSDHADQRLGALVEQRFEKEAIHVDVWRTNGNDGMLEVLDPSSSLFEWRPEIVLMNVCTPALRDKFYSANQDTRVAVIDGFLHALEASITKMRAHGAQVIVSTLALPFERFFGNYSASVASSFLAQVQRVNHHIRQNLAGSDGIQLLDIEYLSTLTGIRVWHDERFWYHAKYPCNPRHLGSIADQLFAVVQSGRGKLVKCIVLDLDNTLWGGVIGDDGLEGIVLGGLGQGEAFRDFQRYLKVLKERGILLCVCSKNEDAAARLPFQQHDASGLREDDFTLFVANWEPKSVNIEWISKTLNIGRDSILFLDDSKYEREEVRSALPEVIVPDLPEDPAQVVRMLETDVFFEVSTKPTDDDAQRTNLYRAESQRRHLHDDAGSIDDFLSSLNLVGSFRPLSSMNLQRAAQLIQRSNQFNLRTQRLDEGTLKGFMDDVMHPCFCVSLKDHFGDYGLISVISTEIMDDAMFLSEFVMSCRVLSRGVEQFICNRLAAKAAELGLRRLIGEYLPTPKNNLVAGLYPKLGFTQTNPMLSRYELRLDGFQPLQTFVKAD
jgi:FkbH-like protein